MQIDYTLEVDPDETPIRGNASATEDPEADRELEDALIDRANRGDVWAWCCVRVIATIEGTDLRGESDWLGGCSYDSARDFIESKFQITSPDGTVTHRGYYDDMCDEAKADLLEKIRAVQRLGELA